MAYAECNATRRDGSPCLRDSIHVDGSLCIFHETDAKDPDIFKAEFERLATQDDDQPVDATGFVFPDLTLQGLEFPRRILFHRARFTARVRFQGCTFHQGADFTDARFEARASFEISLLRGASSFQRARFQEDADFTEATFEGGCDFSLARFEGPTRFLSARFLRDSSGKSRQGYFPFFQTQFQGPTDFSLASFNGTCVFRGARFGSVAQFSSVDIEFPRIPSDTFWQRTGLRPTLDFQDVRVEKTDGVRFTGPGHPNQSPHDIEVGETTPMDLRGLRLHGADVGRMQFADVRWGSADSRRPERDDGVLFDEWAAPKRMPTWTGQDAGGERLALLYKGLRESYERHLMFAEAGRFHIREMECRRRAYGRWLERRAGEVAYPWAARAWLRLAALRRNLSLLGAYRITSNYGESYARAAFSILAWLLLVSSFTLWVRPRLFPQPIPALSLLTEAIRLMPAQVAGDSITDFVGRLIGAFLIAGFIIALRRHFRR